MDKENQSILKAPKKLIFQLLINGDTVKQLLARSRYLLYKSRQKMDQQPRRRAKLLFELYPDKKKHMIYHSNYELSTTVKMIRMLLC
jgi:hypothetical protein